MVDPNYMHDDIELQETLVSTDDNGGVLYRDLRRVTKEGKMSSGRIIHPEYLEEGQSPPRLYDSPRSDVERAMNHYNITEAEYLAHPELYPLPPRGSGVSWPPPMPMHGVGIDWDEAYHFGGIAAECVRGARRQG